ncbi:hypothetical protein [Streptomyces sp. AC550_RSS872]|uniref:hypothetical protein n=1 Tax=Streptomyces sp. AC550_RSS872 TaxID=2823689 RepID=UPI001C27DC0B|nr:hypothetical protein [Streptomyces sp. AC550_RSS872]
MGAGSPQDAVELLVRNHITRGHRTEARVAERDDALRAVDAKPRASRSGRRADDR